MNDETENLPKKLAEALADYSRMTVLATDRLNQDELVILCRECIEAGADLTKGSGYSSTLLMMAAEHGLVELVRLMLESGVPVDQVGSYRKGAVLEAASNNRLDVLRLLIERGADVNIVDTEGFTPLMAAAMDGHAEAALLLVESGADADFKSPHGKAGHLAQTRGFPEIAKAIKEAKQKRQPSRRADLNFDPRSN